MESATTLDKLRMVGASTDLDSLQIFSSPLQRCQHLAAAFCALHNLPLQLDARLMELHFGDWEMHLWQDIPSGLIGAWDEHHVLQAPPGGESFQQLHVRCNAFVQAQLRCLLSSNQPTRNLVLFTHAGVIRALVAAAIQLPLHQAFRLHVDYGSVSALRYASGQMQLAFLNR